MDGRSQTSTEGRQHRADPSPMDLFDTTQLALEGAMHGASKRHQVLATNLANVNTPGYARRDVDFHGALRQAMDTQAQEGGSLAEVGFTEEVDRAGVQRVDGNGVDADVEAAELAKNGLEYDAVLQVAKTRIAIMRSAMGVG